MTAILPDAAAANWVDRYAPERLRPWLKLGRFDRPAGIWLLMLPGWQGIALAAAEKGQLPNPWLLVAFFVGAALMRAAGCAFNDIVDRDFDAQVARTALRPIPAGLIIGYYANSRAARRRAAFLLPSAPWRGCRSLSASLRGEGQRLDLVGLFHQRVVSTTQCECRSVKSCF